MTDNEIHHHKARRKAPAVRDMAPLVQAGRNIDELAIEHGIKPGTLKLNFRRAGISPDTGLPYVRKPMDPRPAEAGFQYDADDVPGEGLCFGTDPKMWFPDEVHYTRRDQVIAQSKAICAQCPIRLRCLEYAIKTKSVGTWGGMTDEERAALVDGSAA